MENKHNVRWFPGIDHIGQRPWKHNFELWESSSFFFLFGVHEIVANMLLLYMVLYLPDFILTALWLKAQFFLVLRHFHHSLRPPENEHILWTLMVGKWSFFRGDLFIFGVVSSIAEGCCCCKTRKFLRGSHSSRAAGLAGGNDVEGCVCATSLQAGPLLYNIYI